MHCTLVIPSWLKYPKKGCHLSCFPVYESLTISLQNLWLQFLLSVLSNNLVAFSLAALHFGHLKSHHLPHVASPYFISIFLPFVSRSLLQALIKRLDPENSAHNLPWTKLPTSAEYVGTNVCISQLSPPFMIPLIIISFPLSINNFSCQMLCWSLELPSVCPLSRKPVILTKKGIELICSPLALVCTIYLPICHSFP